jgi:hypothetical protein
MTTTRRWPFRNSVHGSSNQKCHEENCQLWINKLFKIGEAAGVDVDETVRGCSFEIMAMSLHKLSRK